MDSHPDVIKQLIDKLSRLPGIGPKTAERLVFYLLKSDDSWLSELADNLANLKKQLAICRQCYNVSQSNPCPICQDAKRDQRTICLVAEPQDILVIEKTGEYHGLYHVLGGVINPVEGITPDQLKIKELTDRIKQKKTIQEVIIATNADLEGESTAMYITRQLKALNVKTTRLAKGLPMGSTIEYADEVTISNALKGRQEV